MTDEPRISSLSHSTRIAANQVVLAGIEKTTIDMLTVVEIDTAAESSKTARG